MGKDKRSEFRELRKLLKKEVTKSRYEHIIGVEYISAALAMRYGADLYNAELAGLMHDCAKCIPGDEMLALCKKYNIYISETEERSPYLLHGKLGAYFCRHKYNITDEEVLAAITYHTTGRPGMTLLEKIVYVADYIEPQRDKASDLSYLRKIAFIDIDEAVYQITKGTLNYLGDDNNPSIDSLTRETYDYYKLIHESKKENL